uniref:C-type lectin domain-containing protein n=1 Tax=Astyanax mexicanus TaxID=7994 RepID=A0A3B1JTJ5_ASTMX
RFTKHFTHSRLYKHFIAPICLFIVLCYLFRLNIELAIYDIYNTMKITGIVLFILGLCKLNATLIRHYYINEKMTWPDAQEYCRYHYEDLSTVQNLSELQLLSIGTAVYSWIGLHRNDENASEWNWSGGRDTGFRRWGSEEPSSLSGLDCVRVLIRTTKWSAAQCSTLSHFSV